VNVIFPSGVLYLVRGGKPANEQQEIKNLSSYIVRLYYIRSQHKEKSGVRRVDDFRNETCLEHKRTLVL
jgi:hypothetical protein